jgi:alpha-N-acetylglucosamine transferase
VGEGQRYINDLDNFIIFLQNDILIRKSIEEIFKAVYLRQVQFTFATDEFSLIEKRK